MGGRVAGACWFVDVSLLAPLPAVTGQQSCNDDDASADVGTERQCARTPVDVRVVAGQYTAAHIQHR